MMAKYRVFSNDMRGGRFSALADVTAVSPRDAVRQVVTDKKTGQCLPQARSVKFVAILHSRKDQWGDNVGNLPAAVKKRAIQGGSLWKNRAAYLKKRRATK